ncbi:MAG: tRNA lysidine(34) synthetase TilS [Oscillospiraceae bacterium]|jgi:tRNA(Ile)-lysidine synthase|nr:tRNA lysidine(34) synthetase TilS [Oscillospiraceae bacterium]
MYKLIRRVLEYINEHEMLSEPGSVLVCVSGGADSMCLLEIMRHISYEFGFAIAVAHYNHKLRGEESDRDETFVMEICQAHGIAFYSGRGNVENYAKRNNLGIEEAARDMRYEFFYEIANKTGAAKIATAHTMDDNAETVIINLARGAGANGMSGIPPVRDKVIRPLLRVSRNDVMAFISDRGIPFVEDSSNSLNIFTRNKVRNKLIPLIKEINPRFNEAASTAAELLRADEGFIADIADLFVLECCIGLTADAADLAVLPFSVSSRVIRKLYGGNLSFNHVKDVLALCAGDSPSASLSLPGMVVYREYDRVIFDANPKNGDDEFAPVYPTVGSSFFILGPGLKITCKSVIYDDNMYNEVGRTSFTVFLFKSIDICGKISVRSRREGDSIKLKGQGGTKTLKKLFIEKRIPARKRSLVPVISDDEGVLGIYGLGVGKRAIPKKGEPAILLIFEEI